MNKSYEDFVELIEEIKNGKFPLIKIKNLFDGILIEIQESKILSEPEKVELESKIIFEKKELGEKIEKYKRRISTSDKKELEKIKNEIQNDDKLINELSSCIKDRENAFSTKSDDEPDKEWEPKF